MRKLTITLAAAGLLALASIAGAAEGLDDGDYTLTLPGVGDFEFTIDSDAAEGEDTVVAGVAPDGWEIDDDDAAKVAWKTDDGTEVEVKDDKVEADVTWDGGEVTLALPGGGSITVSQPDLEGDFTVDASDGWTAFGDGSDWVVANNADIAAADVFFVVEADEDGVEIKLTDAPSDGFLNDLEEEDEEVEVEEQEVEEEEEEGEKKEKEDGNPGNGRGRNG